MASRLTMKQKIHVYKTFIAPRFVYALRTYDIPIQSLFSDGKQPVGQDKDIGFDRHIIKMIKKALELPSGCTNDFVYSNTEFGGLGVTPTYEECIVQNINQLFRLLNSADPMVKKIAQTELIAIVKTRHVSGVPVTMSTALQWISGKSIGTQKHTGHVLKSWWTRVKHAFRRSFNKLKTTVVPSILGETVMMTMVFTGTQTVTKTVTIANSSKLCHFLHELYGLAHLDRWSTLKEQGPMIQCVSRSEFSMSILKDPFISDDNWRFAVMSRVNCVKLACASGRRWNNTISTCRRCFRNFTNKGRQWKETQAHVLQHCLYNMPLIVKRHDNIADLLFKVLMSHGINAELETSVSEVKTRLRPDIVVRTKKATYLIDIKVPYDTIKNFDNIRKKNTEKYSDLAAQMKKQTNLFTTVETFVVGSLGSWDPRNQDLLRKLGIPSSSVHALAKAATISTILDSNHMYKEHRSTRSMQGLAEDAKLHALATEMPQ